MATGSTTTEERPAGITCGKHVRGQELTPEGGAIACDLEGSRVVSFEKKPKFGAAVTAAGHEFTHVPDEATP